MASVKWSGLVSEVRGKINGSILSVGYGGQIIRNRRSGGGVTSTSWRKSRANLAYIAGQWRTLTSAQQAAFISAGVSFPYVNKFGDSVTPSGFQLFCTLNSNLNFIAQSLITTAPSPASSETLGTITFSQPSSGALRLAYTATASGLSAIVVYASSAQSLGVYTAPRFMRFVDVVRSNVASPLNFGSHYDRVFGDVPTSGRIFIKVVTINYTTGQRWTMYEGFVNLS